MSHRIDISRFSSYLKLLFTTARVLSFYKRMPVYSFRNALLTPTSDDINEALNFWIRDAQSIFDEKIIQRDYSRLSPKCRHDGIFIVGTRIEKWLNENYNTEGLILLPYEHGLSYLYSLFIHNICHSGIAATVSKVRQRFWIVNLTKKIKSIVNKCVSCKFKRKVNATTSG